MNSTFIFNKTGIRFVPADIHSFPFFQKFDNRAGSSIMPLLGKASALSHTIDIYLTEGKNFNSTL